MLHPTHTQKLVHREVFTQRNLHRDPFTWRVFTHRSFYTQTLLHREVFTRRSFYTRRSFTQRSFYTQKLLPTEKLLHTEAFAQRTFAQWPLYTEEVFTQISLHTQEHLHREVFAQRAIYTQTRLHTKAFTQRSLSTGELLHTKVFTQRTLATECCNIPVLPQLGRSTIISCERVATELSKLQCLSSFWPSALICAVAHKLHTISAEGAIPIPTLWNLHFTSRCASDTHKISTEGHLSQTGCSLPLPP